MGFLKAISLAIFLSTTLFSTFSNAAIFEIVNNCPYTVWGAASPGGGQQMNPNDVWTLSVNAGTAGGRVWARTNCNFDANGFGSCETGDCGGLLQCQGYGAAPNTLAEYSLNQFDNLDFLDISLVAGFNVPMDFAATSNGCTTDITCPVDITAQCPAVLQTPGGCNNPCTVFQTNEYCCTSGPCGPTSYSEFFKKLCPDTYTYPQDNSGTVFTCPGGTNYKVTFCP